MGEKSVLVEKIKISIKNRKNGLWTEFYMIDSDNMNIGMEKYDRTSINVKQVTKTIANLYAPIYYELFKLPTGMSKDLNKFLNATIDYY